MSDESPAVQLARRKGGRPAHGGARVLSPHRCLLRERRVALGLTIEDVAESVGMDRTTLSMVERGHQLYLHHALRIAKFFGCAVEDIWQPLT